MLTGRPATKPLPRVTHETFLETGEPVWVGAGLLKKGAGYLG